MTDHENRAIEETTKLQAFNIMWEYTNAVGSEKVKNWCEGDKEIMRECLLVLFKN